MSLPRVRAPLGATVVITMPQVSSLVLWVASQAVNKLEAEISCLCRQNLSCDRIAPQQNKSAAGEEEDS